MDSERNDSGAGDSRGNRALRLDFSDRIKGMLIARSENCHSRGGHHQE